MKCPDIVANLLDSRTVLTAENIDEVYDSFNEEEEFNFAIMDCMQDIRSGEVETGLACPWSRHYESKSVGSKMSDGTWVGWTCWYGGGKHGEPESIDWMDKAYLVDCKEEEKLVVVQTFTVIPNEVSNEKA